MGTKKDVLIKQILLDLIYNIAGSILYAAASIHLRETGDSLRAESQV